jgi:hypothetical protein
VDKELKRALMHKLGNAINESLGDSDRIAEAIGEIKKAGYDVFIVLEAAIGLNRIDNSEEDGEEDKSEKEHQEPTESSGRKPPKRAKWTSQDQKFLRALKIAPDRDDD